MVSESMWVRGNAGCGDRGQSSQLISVRQRYTVFLPHIWFSWALTCKPSPLCSYHGFSYVCFVIFCHLALIADYLHLLIDDVGLSFPSTFRCIKLPGFLFYISAVLLWFSSRFLFELHPILFWSLNNIILNDLCSLFGIRLVKLGFQLTHSSFSGSSPAAGFCPLHCEICFGLCAHPQLSWLQQGSTSWHYLLFTFLYLAGFCPCVHFYIFAISVCTLLRLPLCCFVAGVLRASIFLWSMRGSGGVMGKEGQMHLLK